MANDQVVVGSSRGSAEGRSSEETLVGRPEAGPLPQKQGEIGWVPPQESPAEPQQVATQPDNQLPARHPADRSTPLPPTPTAPTTNHPNTSTTSLQSRSSAFKQFLRTPRPLPTIHGVRSATILRLALLTFTLIGSIIGWVVTVTKMNNWNKQDSAFINQSPPPDASGNTMTPTSSLDQMTSSSLVFVHVAFGAAILFQLLMLERAVYRFRAERYAFLHPDEMAAMAHGNSVMGLAPWNRPPLPTYAAALGVRGTGDVEDNMIAVPPPPEYGNTRGSTLLLAAHLPPNLTRPRSSQGNGRPTSQGTVRDALGRPAEAWSRPVSYGEDELRQNVRRSMDLETALARLEGPASRPGSSTSVRRPENAVVRT